MINDDELIVNMYKARNESRLLLNALLTGLLVVVTIVQYIAFVVITTLAARGGSDLSIELTSAGQQALLLGYNVSSAVMSFTFIGFIVMALFFIWYQDIIRGVNYLNLELNKPRTGITADEIRFRYANYTTNTEPKSEQTKLKED